MTDEYFNNACRGYVALALVAQHDLTPEQKEKIFNDLYTFGFDAHTVDDAEKIGRELNCRYDEDIAKRHFW